MRDGAVLYSRGTCKILRESYYQHNFELSPRLSQLSRICVAYRANMGTIVGDEMCAVSCVESIFFSVNRTETPLLHKCD